jgi:hypothetical protein
VGKIVLIAVDINTNAEASIRYGIELAARTRSSPVLLAIAAPQPRGGRRRAGELPRGRESDGNEWRALAVTESQHKGLDLEVFVTSGRFFEEIIRFVRSRPSVQFVIIAASRQRERGEKSMFSLELEHLHEECGSEILLVEKAGQVTRVSDLYAQRSERNNAV